MIDQLQDLVEDIISDHWMKLAWFIIAAIGLGAIKRWRDKRKWRLRQFLERVNCSLNIIEDGVLKIRTLFETSLGDILLANHTAEKLVVKAVQRTTKEQPFLNIPESERWYVYNACLNEISERYSIGVLAADIGVPVKKSWYVFALSCEKDVDVRTQKIRILMAQENLLTRIGANQVSEPKYESPNHHVRWNTLRQMAAAHATKPEWFMRIELALPNAPDIDETRQPAERSDSEEVVATETT